MDIIFTAEEYEWLEGRLDEPPRHLPRLAELLREKPVDFLSRYLNETGH